MVRLACASCNRLYCAQRFPWEADEEEEEPQCILVVHAETDSIMQGNYDTLAREDECDQSKSVFIIGDLFCESGTVAKLTGCLLPAALAVCGTISNVGGFVGGFVGVLWGAAQLREGCTTSSGIADPHLIIKGCSTTSMGVASVVLMAKVIIVPTAAAAAAAHPLLLAALVISCSDFCAASLIDATVPGLCCDCRNAPPEDTDAEEIEKSAQASNEQELHEVDSDSIFGFGKCAEGQFWWETECEALHDVPANVQSKDLLQYVSCAETVCADDTGSEEASTHSGSDHEVDNSIYSSSDHETDEDSESFPQSFSDRSASLEETLVNFQRSLIYIGSDDDTDNESQSFPRSFSDRSASLEETVVNFRRSLVYIGSDHDTDNESQNYFKSSTDIDPVAV